MSILVTGGTGFLGFHLLQKLLQADEPVRAIYQKNIPDYFPHEIKTRVQWVQASVLDVVALQDAFQKIKQVYHCAGKVSFLPSDKKYLFKINAEGTANVVNAALGAGVQRLLHVSSVAAIGRAKTGEIINEQCKWEDSPNNSAYALSKYYGEMEVWRGIGEGLRAVIINPSIILGKSSREDGSAALIKTAYNEFPYYTRGINGFVAAQDVVNIMIALMQSDISAQRFIVNGDNWPYQKLFTTLAKYLHKKPPHKLAANWMAEIVWRWEYFKNKIMPAHRPVITRETARTAQLKVYYDNSKLLEYLPRFSFTSLEKTIEEACNAFLEERKI